MLVVDYKLILTHATLSSDRKTRRRGSNTQNEAMKTPFRIGDHVSDGGLLGTVVANIETGEFSAKYTAADWAYLKVGVLVRTDQAGLIHYPDPARLTLST